MMRAMATKNVRIGAEVDPQTNSALEDWAKQEGRSKREQVVVLLRKLVALRRDRPTELSALGLMDSLLSQKQK